MTFDEAVFHLRAVGLTVQASDEDKLLAVADPLEPDAALRTQGVEATYEFGVSIRKLDDGWVLRASPTTAEQFAELADAVSRCVRLFRAHRELVSPQVYGDQFARFEARAPCAGIERALVEAGWLRARPELATLGLEFVAGAHFSVPLPEQRRIVLVDVQPLERQEWRLTVRCHRAARAAHGIDIAVRGHRPDGTLSPDDLAPAASYQVATVIDGELQTAARNVRWSIHRDPERGRHAPHPVPPNT